MSTTEVTHDRDEWLAVRREGIGASDAAAVVGLHPWLSPLALFYEKTSEIVVAEPPTEPMEWGLRLEPVVAAAWCEKNDRRMIRFQPYDPACRRVHPHLPWMVANLDGVVLDNGDSEAAVYEGKTASGWSAAAWDDDLPAHVLIQVQHQLAVTGLPRGHVACLIGGSRFVQYDIERDDELIGSLIEAESRFWQDVQDGRPPAADGYESTTEALKVRWRDSLDTAVELGEEGVVLVRSRHRAKANADEAQQRQQAAENRLRQLLGEAEVGTVFGEIAVTWKPNRAGVRRLIVKEIV